MFTANLRRIRKKKGYTQQQVADALGVTKSTYCGYETGKRQPDVFRLKDIAEFLEVSVDELIGTELGSEDEFTISTSEQSLLDAYRHAPSFVQEAIATLLAPYKAKSQEKVG